jgi:hypothetical protein
MLSQLLAKMLSDVPWDSLQDIEKAKYRTAAKAVILLYGSGEE